MNNITNTIDSTIPLNKTLFAISKNGKWGIQDGSGNQIISYQYDGIMGCNNCIAVLKDNKVGLLNDKGITIIPPCYSYIECVTNNIFYNKEYPFDTSLIRYWYRARVGNVSSANHTDVISSSSPYDNANKLVDGEVAFDTSKAFILHAESYSELFSLERGTFRDSRFDAVYQLTDRFFCVKKDSKYGVYDITTESLNVECDYQRIVYEGKLVVKVQKDGLWGVRTVVINSDRSIDISPKYVELNVLDEKETLFSVKIKNDNGHERYELLDKDGKQKHIETTPNFDDVDSHFIWYSNDLILASVYDKVYGFINSEGNISIPYKYNLVYNLVRKRKDGNFDVNIRMLYEHDKFGKSKMVPITLWGILGSTGSEIVPLKYSDELPEVFDDVIVKDSLSGYYGVLSSKGSESIPCKYKHLMWSAEKDFLYFCHGGHSRNRENTFLGLENYGEETLYIRANFFCDDIDYGTWGCIKKDGSIFIETKYDCFRESEGFIIAGRDGSFVNNDNGYGEEYDGVYDLYGKNGDLIIGGFNLFKYDKTHSLFLLRFGGKWVSERDEIPDIYPTVSYVSNYFDDRNSKWLIVTKDLESVLRLSDGTRKVFDKGFIGIVHEQEKESGRKMFYWNIPLELLSKDEPIINDGIVICGDDNKKYGVNIEDGSIYEKANDVPSEEKPE